MDRRYFYKLILFVFLLLSVGYWSDVISGYLLAKYDIYRGDPKIFVYGLVKADLVEEKFKPYKVEIIFRGCIVGDFKYNQEMEYNKQVMRELDRLRYPVSINAY